MRPPTPRDITIDRRTLILSAVVLLSLLFTAPALAEYLGPDRVTSVFKQVRVPEKDVWTLEHVDPFDPYLDVCLIIHTCDEHPSVERQLALCGWVADKSGCTEWWEEQEVAVTLPEATVASQLLDCDLNNGWCTTTSQLQITAAEPLDGESITLIEGTRNGEPFACEGDICSVPLLEGGNDFAYWALSTWGDSSRPGNLSAQVDTLPPSSAFLNPAEGSVVWVSGVLDISGSSSDAHSGVVSVELSLDGGASWQPLALGVGGGWGYSWDTSSVPDGGYLVLARASDLAGHLESTARISVYVDRTPPTIEIPDAWHIWEPLDIQFDDGGIGVERVELTIQGGAYGTRKYNWSPGNVPKDFIWDRYFGDVVAPIGEYRVVVEVWDQLGNLASASGRILVPAPETETEARPPLPTEAPAESPASDAPLPTATAGGNALVVVSTPTSEPIVALVPDAPLGPTSLEEPEVVAPPSDDGSTSPLLWGAAALAAVSAAAAYGLSRRKKREDRIEAKRKEIAEQSSQQSFAGRLRSLRQRAEARIAPIRAGLIAAAAAAAKAAREVQQRGKVQYRLERFMDRLERLGEPSLGPEQTVGWAEPDEELIATQSLGRIYSLPELTGEVPTPPPTGTPTPEGYDPEPTGTPPPPGFQDQPQPLLAPIAPYPPGYLPNDPDLQPIEGKWIGRALRLGFSGWKTYAASAVQYTALEGSKVSVSVPELPGWFAGSRPQYASRYGLRPGPYTPTGLARAGLRQLSLRKLAQGAKGTVGVGLLSSLAANVYDFGVGGKSDQGFGREFAVSTGVDFALTVGIGLTAAGAVSVGAAGAAVLLGITAPVWATIVATAAIGLTVGIVLDALGVGDGLKARVNSGIDAWPGIIQNGMVIAGHATNKIGESINGAVQTVTNTVSNLANSARITTRQVGNTIATGSRLVSEAARATAGEVTAGIRSAADDIAGAAQEVTSKIADAAESVVDSARQFIGNLFGGGD